MEYVLVDYSHDDSRGWAILSKERWEEMKSRLSGREDFMIASLGVGEGNDYNDFAELVPYLTNKAITEKTARKLCELFDQELDTDTPDCMAEYGAPFIGSIINAEADAIDEDQDAEDQEDFVDDGDWDEDEPIIPAKLEVFDAINPVLQTPLDTIPVERFIDETGNKVN